MAQRDVQKMKVGSFSKRCNQASLKAPVVKKHDPTPDWDPQVGGDAHVKILGGFPLEIPPHPHPLYPGHENGFDDEENRLNEASERRERHTCVNAKTWKRMHSCVIILFISRIRRKYQLFPWKAGKSSADKSKMTQCC